MEESGATRAEAIDAWVIVPRAKTAAKNPAMIKPRASENEYALIIDAILSDPT